MAIEKQEQGQEQENDFQQHYDAIKDTPEFAAILNQHGQVYHSAKMPELEANFMGKAWNQVDKAYLEGMGLKERPKGKTGDLVLQLAKDYQQALQDLEQSKTKKTDNSEEEIIKAEMHKNQLSALQNQLNELQKANESLKTQGKQQKARNSLSNALIGESFDPNLSDGLLSEIKTLRINRAVSNSKEIDGKTIYYNEDGEQYTNPNGLPMSAKEVAKEIFKDLFFAKKAGGKPPKDGDKPHVKGDIVVMPNPTTITNFTQFDNEFKRAVASKGWASHEERYIKLQKATLDYYFPKGFQLG